MKKCAITSLAAAIVLTVLFLIMQWGIFETLAITFGTTAYHFWIRLLIGYVFDSKMKNHADYHKRWYQVGIVEKAIYEKLKVKAWKNKMPTYDTDAFDIRQHTWDEVAQATCQSELVHETNVIFSFIPIAASVCFGALPVFVITSVLAAAYDLMFVMMQRYNRARIIKILKG